MEQEIQIEKENTYIYIYIYIYRDIKAPDNIAVINLCTN